MLLSSVYLSMHLIKALNIATISTVLLVIVHLRLHNTHYIILILLLSSGISGGI